MKRAEGILREQLLLAQGTEFAFETLDELSSIFITLGLHFVKERNATESDEGNLPGSTTEQKRTIH